MNAPYRPDSRVRALLERFAPAADECLVPLADLKREVYQYGKRRCDVEASRDNLKFYMGAAFEVNEALDIDSLAMTGLLSLPASVFLSLFAGAPKGTVADLCRAALAYPRLHLWAIEKGVWLQWKRLEALYRAETEEFRNSEAFHRPGWRKKNVTRDQRYMIGEIRRLLGIEVPPLVNRGEVFTFIETHGGNPRFRVEPLLPATWWAA